jgi:hypothetical protein
MTNEKGRNIAIISRRYVFIYRRKSYIEEISYIILKKKFYTLSSMDKYFPINKNQSL